MTTGSKNVIIGGFSGNAGGLDLRTSSNNVLLSDGDGNVRFYANSSGNVGIGETSPDSILHIKKNQSSAASALKLENSAGGDNSEFDIDFQMASSGLSAKIGVIRTNSPGAGDTDMFFSTSNNGTTATERMRINYLGQVGINRTPSITNSKLEVGGADNVPLINVEASGNTGGIGIGSNGLQFFHGSSSKTTIDSSGVFTCNGGIVVDQSTFDANKIATNQQSGHSGNFTIDAAADIILDAAGGDFNYKINGTEIFRISNSALNTQFLQVQSNSDMIFKGNDGGSEITALTLDMSEAGAATFNNNITAFSDRRLKDNIKTLDSQKTYQMRGVSYTRDGVPGSGVIAQELEEVAPELVLTNDDGIKSVDYGRTIGYLIETIKDLKKEVEDLKDDITSLRK